MYLVHYVDFSSIPFLLYHCAIYYNSLFTLLPTDETWEEREDRIAKQREKDLINRDSPLVPEDKPIEPNQEISKFISIYNGDITTLEVDGILNAANASLQVRLWYMSTTYNNNCVCWVWVLYFSLILMILVILLLYV